MAAQENAPRVAAVVVTYNRQDMLRQCFNCLLGQNDASCDVLVIDNASTDGTHEMIGTEYDLPQVKYFNTGYNLGGAGGFMCGIDAAVQMGYDRIWIMDDDCLPSETALAELLKADESLDGNWGFLCSAIYWTDGEICRFNRPKKDVFRHVDAADYENSLVSVKMTSFVSVMFRADVVREVGLPIAEYFIWTDDYEYTGRISKRYPCYAVPSSRVTHAMKENARPSLATEDIDRINRFYYLSRNDVHCYRQHGALGYLYLAVKAAYTATDVLVNAKGGRKERLSALANGTRDGLSFSPTVYGNKSKPVQPVALCSVKESNRDTLVKTVSHLKNNQLLRIATIPFMQASFDIGDIRYRTSDASRAIAAMRDTHIGERCFIVGNGPSLTASDLDALRNEFTFAANRIYMMFDKTEWRPSVYVAVDREMIANECERIRNLKVPLKLVRKTQFSKTLEGEPGIVFINSHAHHYTIKRFSNGKVAFSDRPDLVLYDGFTVTYVAMQLALFMGFSEIYLIGMDHTFTNVVDPDGTLHTNEGVKDHCFNDPEGAVINPQPKEGVELAYRMARIAAGQKGAHIYNATRGGALEIFERVDLDAVLKTAGDDGDE